MSQIHVEVSEMIDARPEEIYAVLSDYQEAHPAILPKPYFAEVTVEQGGKGAGTILRVHMKVMGVERTYHCSSASQSQVGYWRKPTRMPDWSRRLRLNRSTKANNHE